MHFHRVFSWTNSSMSTRVIAVKHWSSPVFLEGVRSRLALGPVLPPCFAATVPCPHSERICSHLSQVSEVCKENTIL